SSVHPFRLLFACLFSFFFLFLARPPRSPLFPYTTLFRSLTAYAAAPGVLGWWLARRTRHDGGPRVLAALAAVQGWLVLGAVANRSEEHTSELQSRENLVCRLLLEKKKYKGSAAQEKLIRI